MPWFYHAAYKKSYGQTAHTEMFSPNFKKKKKKINKKCKYNLEEQIHTPGPNIQTEKEQVKTLQ